MTIRLIVMWPSSEGDDFDAQYGAEHVPLVKALPGLENFVVSPVRSRSHALMAELFFADSAALKTAMGSEAGVELAAHTRALEKRFEVASLAIVVDEPAARARG